MATVYDQPTSAQVSSTSDGRVTIPAGGRRLAGIEPGQTLMIYVEDGRVVIEERAHLLARIQNEAIRAAVAAGHTGSAADELIADRRVEADREAANS